MYKHPGIVWLILTIATAEWWGITAWGPKETGADWTLVILVSLCASMYTMIPCGIAVGLFWAAMGWWNRL